MQITLFLMNEKGFKVLEHLLQNFETSIIFQVVVAEDKNVAKDFYKEIVELCKKNKIPFYNKNNYNLYKGYAFAIGWRWIIPQQEKLIVLHESLLPKYRGFSPLVSALINGDKTIGVTALFASKEYDRGEIIHQEKIEINYPIKIKNAIEQISELYQKIVKIIVNQLLNKEKLKCKIQDESHASYGLWRNEEDYLINWNQDAEQIKRFVNAVGFPYLGASSFIKNKKIRILDVGVLPDVKIENRTPGKVIFIKNQKPIVVCKKGLIQINEMIDDETKQSALPLKYFRTIFN